MNSPPPTFLKRVAATWIDFVLLIGVFILLGFISEHLFLKEAYPQPTGMQLYSERDFDVFWFFLQSTAVIVTLYLAVSYGAFKGTLGQYMLNIRMLGKDGSKLSQGNILLRIMVVLIRLFLISVPGPIAAILFLMFSIEIFNEAFSLVLLLGVTFGLFYRSYTKYRGGKVRSLSDRISGTIFVDLTSRKTELVGVSNG